MTLKLLILTSLLLASCSGMQFNMPISFTGNEIGRSGGVEQDTTKTITNTQTTKALQEKMDAVKNTVIKITPELKKEISKGESDAAKFMNNKPFIKKISNTGENEFYKKNPRIHTCRQELRYIAEQGWEMGLRFLIVECQRSKKRQKELVKKGASQTTKSMHNYSPSRAYDFVVLNIKTGKPMWSGGDALRQFAYTIGAFRAIAEISIGKFGWNVVFQSGADWKMTDSVYQPTSLRDWAHVALRDRKIKKVIMQEIWREFREGGGYYLVSNLGRVESKDRNRHPGRVLRQHINRRYYGVPISVNGRKRNIHVHRLVAKAFCPGYKNGLHVNHKDLNPLNNKWTNLEWVTPQENVAHTWKHKRKQMLAIAMKGSLKARIVSAKVLSKKCQCIETGINYKSTTDASNKTGIYRSGISRACQGTRKSAGGFTWRYV